jgi:hypothetical protein
VHWEGLAPVKGVDVHWEGLTPVKVVDVRALGGPCSP